VWLKHYFAWQLRGPQFKTLVRKARLALLVSVSVCLSVCLSLSLFLLFNCKYVQIFHTLVQRPPHSWIIGDQEWPRFFPSHTLGQNLQAPGNRNCSLSASASYLAHHDLLQHSPSPLISFIITLTTSTQRPPDVHPTTAYPAGMHRPGTQESAFSACQNYNTKWSH
jgi:hypothetical protein